MLAVAAEAVVIVLQMQLVVLVAKEAEVQVERLQAYLMKLNNQAKQILVVVEEQQVLKQLQVIRQAAVQAVKLSLLYRTKYY